MDNQHKKITGYRDLSQEEVDLMNEIKAIEAQVADLHKRVTSYQQSNVLIESSQRQDAARNLAIARNELQTGFMWFVRGIALPVNNW